MGVMEGPQGGLQASLLAPGGLSRVGPPLRSWSEVSLCYARVFQTSPIWELFLLMRIEIHQVSFAHPIGRIRTFWGRTWEFVFINTDV